MHAELAALRQELDELRSRPVTEEDWQTSVPRSSVWKAGPTGPRRSRSCRRKSARSPPVSTGLPAVGELANKLDAVAGQAEVAQTGIAGLSRRVDELSGLERRLDELASRLPGDDVIEELRRALTDLATQAGADDRSTRVRTSPRSWRGSIRWAHGSRMSRRPAIPTSAPRIDDLSARVDEIAARDPGRRNRGSGDADCVARGGRSRRQQGARAPRGRARRTRVEHEGSAGRNRRPRARHVAGGRASGAGGRAGG